MSFPCSQLSSRCTSLAALLMNQKSRILLFVCGGQPMFNEVDKPQKACLGTNEPSKSSQYTYGYLSISSGRRLGWVSCAVFA
eukprot:scaffold14782_cov124-Skeletonema_marinoi.AAC.3